MSQENIAAGSIEGVVTSFVSAKGYGFISGDDGERYFVHQHDVHGGETLITGQRVTFEPTPSPKGSKARRVVPGLGPTPIYLEPDSFIWSKGGAPRGMDVVLVTGNGWGESNDPNEARELLAHKAREWGANAVLNVTMHKWTDSAACSNYRWTMHRFSGEFAVVKVVSSSSDPDVIARSEHEMQNLFEWWNSRNAPQDNAWDRPSTETRLIEPAKIKLVLGLLWAWSLTFMKILGLTLRYCWQKAVPLAKSHLASWKSRSKKKPEAPEE